MTDQPPRPRLSYSKEKWTSEVVKEGYTILPSILLLGQRRLGVSPELLNVILHLSVHWWYKDHLPYPAKRVLAQRMGKSERQIQRYITELENRGYVKRIPKYKEHGGQVSNRYSLDGLVSELKRIAPDFEKARKGRQNVEKPRFE